MHKPDLTFLYPELTAVSVIELAEHLQDAISVPGSGTLVLLPPQARKETQLSERISAAVNAYLEKTGTTPDLVMTTSGSRSIKPHLVGISWQAMIASAKNTNEYLQKNFGGNEKGTWLLALPTHHIAGLQIVLRSILAGTNPVIVEGNHSFTVERFDAASAQMPTGPRFTSLVPTQLNRLISDSTELQKFSAILVGGARIDDQLLSKTASIPLVTTYGMTETCGGCVYDGLPMPGVEIMTENKRVLLSGEVLFDAYLDEETPIIKKESRKWLVTNDEGFLDSEGLLHITGRSDDVIISGGENISASAVREAVEKNFSQIGPVEVLALPDPQWGQSVAISYFTPTQQVDQVGPAIYEFVKEALGIASAPRVVLCLPEAPLLSNGKVDYKTLVEIGAKLVDTTLVWKR